MRAAERCLALPSAAGRLLSAAERFRVLLSATERLLRAAGGCLALPRAAGRLLSAAKYC